MSGIPPDKFKQKGKGGDMAPLGANPLEATSSTDPLSRSQNASPQPKQSRRKELLRKLFSGSKTPPIKADVPPPPAAYPTNDAQPSSTEESLNLERANLASKQTEVVIKEGIISDEKKKEMLDLGIQVIDILQGAASLVGMVFPDPLSDVLGKISDALGVLKKMVENKEAWVDLLREIDSHQDVFNFQLRRLKADDLVPDPDSPLLGPAEEYSKALEGMVAKVIDESGLAMKNGPTKPKWEKVKTFVSRFMDPDSEKGKIGEYMSQLSGAMDRFKLSLEIFVGFTVHGIALGMTSLTAEMNIINEKIDDISEPVDNRRKQTITAFGSQHKTCLGGTRIQILKEIKEWAYSNENLPSVYCIGDVAGTGKSTIAKTMAKEWSAEENLAANFFFSSQESASIGMATHLCFSIKDQLEATYPNDTVRAYWNSISAKLKVLPSMDIEEQWKILVQQPISIIAREKTVFLVIDALDECVDIDGRGRFLRSLLDWVSSEPKPAVRILLTTRNEEDLKRILDIERYHSHVRQKALFIECNTADSSDGDVDITVYVNHRLDEHGILRGDLETRRILIKRCGGLFIFASLACDLLKRSVTRKEALKTIMTEFTSMDSIYHQVLKHAEDDSSSSRESFTTVLGLILVARTPLSITAISSLLPPSLGIDVKSVVEYLGSVLAVRAVDGSVFIVHATFAEFLVRQHWKQGKIRNQFVVSTTKSSLLMTEGCLRTLSEQLKDTIPDILDPNSATLLKLDSKYLNSIIVPNITCELRYAASQWIPHMIPRLHISHVREAMRHFLKHNILRWIAFGSITGMLPALMIEFDRLAGTIKNGLKLFISSPKLERDALNEEDSKRCRDVFAFLQRNQVLIQAHPLNALLSALAFESSQSTIYQDYYPSYREVLPKATGNVGPNVKPGRPLALTEPGAGCMAYSSDGMMLISAHVGRLVFWNAQNGTRLSDYSVCDNTLELKYSECQALALSLDDQVFFSVWRELSWPTSVMPRFSYYRGGCLASMVTRMAVKLDMVEEDLKGQGGDVKESYYFQQGLWVFSRYHLTAGTPNGRIVLFSLNTGSRLGGHMQAHSKAISSMSVSPDKTQLASGSEDGTIKVWQVLEDRLDLAFEWVHDRRINSLRLLPASTLVCSGSTSIWAIHMEEKKEIMRVAMYDAKFVEGPLALDHILCSSNGAIHRISSTTSPHQLMQLPKNLRCMVVSPRGDQIAVVRCETGSEGIALVDLTNGNAESDGPETSGANSSEILGVAFSTDGTQLVTGDDKGRICTWNVETGVLIQGPIKTGLSQIDGVACSPDASTVALACLDGIVLRAAVTGEEIRLWFFHWSTVYGLSKTWPVLFSPDGTRLVVLPSDTLLIFTLGESPDVQFFTVKLGKASFGRNLAFHENGQHIVYGDMAYDLTATLAGLSTDVPPPSLFSKISSPMSCTEDRTSVCIGSPPRRKFSIPLEFNVNCCNTRKGLIALGAEDGTFWILDCTHLLSKAERENIELTRTMLAKAVARMSKSTWEMVTANRKLPIVTNQKDLKEGDSPWLRGWNNGILTGTSRFRSEESRCSTSGLDLSRLSISTTTYHRSFLSPLELCSGKHANPS